ncbi:BnaA08g13420D [Brassica napus]|uniref:(rape) hypothetical protein n=1 Tax=Brassica napus TaxID=3708 RepID=A0A078FM77_BRANA|nr:unnamed protein product [Brassica napus]CDY14211.1 BnaA08g13420D [Brassica napus]
MKVISITFKSIYDPHRIELVESLLICKRELVTAKLLPRQDVREKEIYRG